MAVQVDLLQRFLDTLTEDAAKGPLLEMFKRFEAMPLATTSNGLEHLIFYYLKNEDAEYKASAINGLCIGIFMARISEDPLLRKFFEKQIELYKRHMGENVTQLNQYKIEKKR